MLIEAGRFDDALQLIDDVIDTRPDDVRFAIAKAELYFTRLDDLEKALAAIDLALERAFETGDFRREALGVKARILLKLGRGEELGQVLEQIMSQKMAPEFRDVPKERDFVDAAPARLIRDDILARYQAFYAVPRTQDSDDPEEWTEYDLQGHCGLYPDGDPITPDELDQMILSVFSHGKNWRKTAAVIGGVSHECEAKKRATSHSLIFHRVLDLVDSGVLESQGPLSRWRYSEVRPARRGGRDC